MVNPNGPQLNPQGPHYQGVLKYSDLQQAAQAKGKNITPEMAAQVLKEGGFDPRILGYPQQPAQVPQPQAFYQTPARFSYPSPSEGFGQNPMEVDGTPSDELNDYIGQGPGWSDPHSVSYQPQYVAYYSQPVATPARHFSSPLSNQGPSQNYGAATVSAVTTQTIQESAKKSEKYTVLGGLSVLAKILLSPFAIGGLVVVGVGWAALRITTIPLILVSRGIGGLSGAAFGLVFGAFLHKGGIKDAVIDWSKKAELFSGYVTRNLLKLPAALILAVQAIGIGMIQTAFLYDKDVEKFTDKLANYMFQAADNSDLFNERLEYRKFEFEKAKKNDAVQS